MLLHEGPLEHALVVCYGVGVTAGAVTHIPSLESIDVAEISRDVVVDERRHLSRRRRHPLRRSARPAAHRGRPLLPADDGRAVRSDHRRAAAAADAWHGEHLHARVFSARPRSARRGRHRHLLGAGGASRIRARTSNTIVRAFCDVFERLLAVERDAVRPDARRHRATRAGPRDRGAVRPPLADARARGAAARGRLRTARADRRDVSSAMPTTCASSPRHAAADRRLSAAPAAVRRRGRRCPIPRYGADPAVDDACYQSMLDPSRARARVRARRR